MQYRVAKKAKTSSYQEERDILVQHSDSIQYGMLKDWFGQMRWLRDNCCEKYWNPLCEAFSIYEDEEKIGGVVLKIDFEKRNIHFYVNKCGFKIVEFFNKAHRHPEWNPSTLDFHDEFFVFEKVM